jgi:hypothetical protein
MVLNFTNQLNFFYILWIHLSYNFSYILQIFLKSGKRQSNKIYFMLYTEIQYVVLIIFIYGWKVYLTSRKTHVLFLTESSIVLNLYFHYIIFFIYLCDNWWYRSICNKYSTSNFYRSHKLFIWARYPLICALMGVIGCQF